MAELPSGPLAAVDPRFEVAALEVAAFTYNLPGTTTAEKLLLCLANDVCRGHLGLAFELHVEAALGHGVSPSTLAATIRFVAPAVGYPAAADALGRLAGLVRGPLTDGTGPAPDTPSSAGDVAAYPTGDGWLARFSRSRAERAASETALTPKQQAFLSLTVDVAQQQLGAPLEAHVAAALRAGATVDDIRSVLRFTAEFSVANAAAALSALEPIVAAAQP